MKGNTLALLAVFLSSILGGAIVPLIKISLQAIPPFSFTFLRFLIALLFIILPIFFKEKPKLKDIFKVAPVSLLSTANIIIFILAVRYIPANIGQLIYVTTPVIVGLLSYFIFKETMSFYKILGILLGLFGSLFLFFSNTVYGFSSLNNIFGILMIFLGAILYSFFLIFSKRLQKKYSPIYITFVFNLTTILASLVFLSTELSSFRVENLNFSAVSIGSLLYVGVFGTTIYYLLGQYAIKYGSPIFSSIILYVQVPFTIIWANFLIGEKVTLNFWIAAILIIIGSVLVSKSNKQTKARD